MVGIVWMVGMVSKSVGYGMSDMTVCMVCMVCMVFMMGMESCLQCQVSMVCMVCMACMFGIVCMVGVVIMLDMYMMYMYPYTVDIQFVVGIPGPGQTGFHWFKEGGAPAKSLLVEISPISLWFLLVIYHDIS